jgi:hypothetical protein
MIAAPRIPPPALWFAVALTFTLSGCATAPSASSIAGQYFSEPQPWQAMMHVKWLDGSNSVPLIVYHLVLNPNGSFKTARTMSRDGVSIKDSSLHAGGYDPHEAREGTWRLIGDRLILADGTKSYEARIRHANGGWSVSWDSIEYHPKPPNYQPGDITPLALR